MTAENILEEKKENLHQLLPAAESDIFEWTKQWYPVAVVDYLDPSRPHAIQLQQVQETSRTFLC
ncbi:MAG: hypothetical protein GDA56_22510 [Hormoscilla sp. GM7CHS1pb]|nr:hypothetical protein [Hormoscilla sp. GM7CHS1pb]